MWVQSTHKKYFNAEKSARMELFMENVKTVETMVKEANAVENANYTVMQIPQELTNALTSENNAVFTKECITLASKSRKDFFNLFFMPTLAKISTAQEFENIVKFAVSVAQKKLVVTDSGLLKIEPYKKIISMQDVINAKVSGYATKHADNKPTKTDKSKAFRFYFGDNGKGLIDMVTYQARIFASIGNIDDTDEIIKGNPDYEKAFAKVADIYAKKGTDNPFIADNNIFSNTKRKAQIENVIAEFVDIEKLPLFAYHCKALLQMIASRNKYGKLTILSAVQSIDALAIICRYCANGHKLPENDKSDIFKIAKDK